VSAAPATHEISYVLAAASLTSRFRQPYSSAVRFPQAQAMSSLCSTFRRQAGWVLEPNEGGPSQGWGIALSEETITETVFYEILKEHQSSSEIEISLAKEARRRGAWRRLGVVG